MVFTRLLQPKKIESLANRRGLIIRESNNYPFNATTMAGPVGRSRQIM